MSPTQLLLFLVVVHVLGFVAVGLLIIPALRDDDTGHDEDTGSSDDGWGNLPSVKPDPNRWPGGGIPLPDAQQSLVRLRGPGKLADKVTAPHRRPSREPERAPARTREH